MRCWGAVSFGTHFVGTYEVVRHGVALLLLMGVSNGRIASVWVEHSGPGSPLRVSIAGSDDEG